MNMRLMTKQDRTITARTAKSRCFTGHLQFTNALMSVDTYRVFPRESSAVLHRVRYTIARNGLLQNVLLLYCGLPVGHNRHGRIGRFSAAGAHQKALAVGGHGVVEHIETG